jgi:hypothetical protein
MSRSAAAPGPVISGLDADIRNTTWVIAGRPAHRFTGRERDQLCRVCAGPRDGVDHPPRGRYSEPGEVVKVLGALTGRQFRRIGALLDTNLGRHKEWASLYIFEPRSTETADAICAFLREQNIPHDRETTRRWTP